MSRKRFGHFILAKFWEFCGEFWRFRAKIWKTTDLQTSSVALGVVLKCYASSILHYGHWVVMDYKTTLRALRSKLSSFYNTHCYFCGIRGLLLVSLKHSVRVHEDCLIRSKGSSIADSIIQELHIATVIPRKYPINDVWDDEWGFWHVKNSNSLYLSLIQAERAADDRVARANRLVRNGNVKLGIEPKIKPDTKDTPGDTRVIGSLVWGMTGDGTIVKAVVLGKDVSRNELKETLSRYVMAYSQDKFGRYIVRTNELSITHTKDLTMHGYSNLRMKAEPPKNVVKRAKDFKSRHYDRVRGEIQDFGYLPPEEPAEVVRIERPLITRDYHTINKAITSDPSKYRSTRGWTGNKEATEEEVVTHVTRVATQQWEWTQPVRRNNV